MKYTLNHKKVLINTLTILVFLLLGSAAMGQITIGTQVTESSTSGASPYNYYWESRRVQFVYTAEEIQSSGGSAGNITAIAWDVSQVNADNLLNYEIKIGHTSASDASSHISTTLTTVKNAHTLTPGSTGWRTISFDNPFVWNGSDNIIIDVCWGINSSYTSSGKIWLYNNVSNQLRTVNSSSSNQCNSNTTTTSYGKPRIQLTITGACTQPSTQATTSAYTNNNTGNSVTVNWARGNGNNILVVGRLSSTSAVTPSSGTAYTANSTFGSGNTTGTNNFVVYNGTGTSVTVTGLTSGNTYAFDLYEYNTTGTCYKTPSATSSVTVSCATISSNPYIESFESSTAPPNCWSVIYENSSPASENIVTHSSTVASEGTKSFRFSSNSSGSPYHQWLISPELNYSTDMKVQFKYRRSNTLYNESFRLGYSSSGTNTNSDFTWQSTIDNHPTTSWAEYEYIIPAGTKYISIHYNPAGWYQYLYIDDFQISPPTSCQTPTTLSSFAITSTAATISWNAPTSAPSDGYQYYYSTSSTAPTSGTTPSGSVAAGVTTANLSGLTGNTTYYFWARSNCGSGTTSDWSASDNFTTGKGEPTNQPTNFTFSSVFSSSISFSWTAAVAGSQAPDGYLIKGSSSDFGSITNPVDGTDPADATTYSSGLANRKVSGASSTFGSSFSGMTAGTMYYHKIYSYTNTGSSINFKTDNVPSFKHATTPDAVSSQAIAATSTTTANITWTLPASYNSTAHSVMVFIKAASSVTTGTPSTPPSNYTANTAFGSGTAYQNDASAYCVYKGDGTSVSVTGLTQGTTYHILIYTVVDEENSNGSSSYSSSRVANATTQSTSPVPYLEGFSTTSTPAGWNTSGWTIGTTRGVTGNPGNNIYKNLYSSSTTATFTSTNIGPIVSGNVLSFDYITANYSSPYNVPDAGSGDFVVSISTDFGNNYSVLETVSNSGQAGWHSKQYDLTSYIGEYIKFRIVGNWISGDYDLAFDNFSVDDPATCIAPTLPASSNVTSNSADLSWTAPTSAPSHGYHYYLSTSSTAPTSGSTPTGSTSAGTTNISVNSLSGNTTYYFWIRSNCDSEASLWSSSNSFTTLKAEPENQVINFAAGTVSTTQIPLSWTAAVSGSQSPDGYLVKLSTIDLNSVENAVDGDDPANVTSITANAANKKVTPGSSSSTTSFSGMNPGTMYYYKIFSYTNSGSSINFKTSGVPTLSHATLPTAVSSTTLTPTSGTTASITWSNTGYNSSDWQTLVFVKAASSITSGTPTNSPSTYTANTAIGSGTSFQNDASAYCVYNGDGSSVDISGLTPGTTYHVSIFTVVSNANSNTTHSYSSANTSSGTPTSCPSVDVPYTQNFETATPPSIPDCNTTENAGTGNNWTTASNPGYGFTNKTLRYSYHSTNAANAWYFTQGINLIGGTTYTMSFKYGSTGSTFAEKLKVSYGTTASSAGMTNLLYNNNNVINSTPNTEAIEFTPSISGVYYFGFNAYSDANKWHLFVDDISVNTSNSCQPPSSLASSVISITTATISWDAPASAPSDGYQYYYSTSSTAPTSGTTPSGSVAAGFTTANLSGLTGNTTYYFWVRSNCGSGTTSDWSASGNFTTGKGEPTNQPTNFTFSLVFSSTISFSWTAAIAGSQAPDGYLIKGSSTDLNSITNPVDGTDPSDVTTYSSGLANRKVSGGSSTSGSSFSGMTAGTMYYHKIYSYTNSGSSIDFNTTNPPSFYHATMPNSVSSPNFSSSNATSATISWSAASDYNSANHSTLVFVKASSSITEGSPTASPSTYTANTTFGSGTAYQNDASAYCVYKGDGTSVTISGLSAGVTYYVVIYTVVDQQNSNNTNTYSYSRTTSGSTGCGTFTPPYSEDFASGVPPSCWTRFTGILESTVTTSGTTSSWSTDGFGNNGTTGAARINIFGTSRKDWLITPSIDLGDGSSSYQLEFDLALTAWNNTNPPQTTGSDDKFAVVISTDNGATWTSAKTLKLWNNSGSSNVYNNISPTGQTEIIDLSGYTGEIKIGFYGESTVSNADNDLFIDNVKIIASSITCGIPSNIASSAINSTSATITWTAASPAPSNGYQYEVRTSGTPGSGASGLHASGSTAAGVTTFDASGLSANTNYYVYVRSDCGSSTYSSWTSAHNFITACGVITSIPYFEGFENAFPPNCWTNNGWSQTYGTARTGTKWAYNNISGNTLTSPEITIPAGTTTLSFWYRAENSSYPQNFRILISTDGTNFSTLQSFTNITTTTYTEHTHNLSSYNGQNVKIRFEGQTGSSSFNYGIMFDDFYIFQPISCPQPIGLTVSDITHESANLSWTETGTATSWDIEVGLSDFSASGTPTHSAISNNPYTISSLNANTEYEFYVRSNCGGENSAWSGPFSFQTTPPPCDLTIDFSSSIPTPSLENDIYYFDVCNNTELKLLASADCDDCASATYEWNINAYDGNGIVSSNDNPLFKQINRANGYDGVLLVTTESCRSDFNFRIRSSSGPIIENISATIDACAGNQTQIVIGQGSSQIDVSPYNAETTAALGSGDTTFIPDGKNCTELCYESTVTFTDFPIGSIIESEEDILYLKINLEHTFIGDLQISLVGPNNCGSVIILQDYQSDLDPFSYTWPHKNGIQHLRIGFGASDTSDLSNPTNPCDLTHIKNAPGIGWNYCWSNNPDYSYANGNKYVYDPLNMTTYPNTPFFRVNPSNIDEKTNFYIPFQNFTNLRGCQLNGTWTVKICDSWAEDNGWIFDWELALNPDLLPQNWSYESEIESVSWDLGVNASAQYVSGGNGSALTYTINPSPSLTNGSYSGNFTVYDEFGCGTAAQIDYTVQGVPNISSLSNGDYIWAGYTNENWDNTLASNWLQKTASGFENAGQTPDGNSNVYIVDYCSVSAEPTVLNSVSCKDLIIIDGTLQIGENQIVSISGNFDNQSNFEANNGRLIFNGTTDQYINSGGDNFYNMITNKASGNIVLQSPLTIENSLDMLGGNINTNGQNLTIGTSILNTGEIHHTSGAIFGSLSRWFASNTNSGNTSGLFPVGHPSIGTNYLPLLLEYSVAPTGGTITVRFVAEDMGAFPSDITIPATGSCSEFDITSVSGNGYWNITTGNGFSGGTYDITLYPNGIGTINNLCEITALKRPNAGTWEATHGTHIEPDGTINHPIIKRTSITSGFSDWGIGGSSLNPLPVDLVHFEAKCSQNEAIIHWITASEVNNSHFVLEKSDDLINYNQIAIINGQGNKNAPTHYKHSEIYDYQNSPTYYRLKQYDFDGTETIHGIISLNCKNKNENSAIIYPNPFNNKLHITLNQEHEDVTFEMFDEIGKKVFEQKMSNIESQITLDFENLKSGVYILKIRNNQMMINLKVIKQ